MIPVGFTYERPDTLDAALALLAEHGDDAKVLAGGHSLLPVMKLRLAAPELLVDLRRVPGLSKVSRDNGTIRFGAMVRHHVVATGGFGLPSMAAATIADQQVRNAGTIGGTLAHGDPASDMPAILLLHEGSVVVRGSDPTHPEREIAAADLFEDYLTTAIGEDEILTEVRFPALEGYGYGYHKFNRRQEDWAMVAVGAAVKVSGGVVEDVRIGLTHMSSVPLRATASEEALRGKPATPENLAAAAELAAEGTEPPADLNASQDYKRHLARVLTRRALEDASQ
jgi:aerobic carbon-monoxide dehydrogenase medium subunit